MRDWMREAREKKGLTKRQAAAALGISEAYYGFIEKGTRQQRMDITLASRLSRLFDIPIQDIAALEAPFRA